MNNLVIYIYSIILLSGKKVKKLMLLSAVAGVLNFLLEIFFIVVLQSFLVSIKLVDLSKTEMPKWLPNDINSTTGMLLFFGVARGFLVAINSFLIGSVNHTFIAEQRAKLLEFAFLKNKTRSTHEIVGIFSERIQLAAGTIALIASLIPFVISSFLLLIYGFKLAPIEMFIGICIMTVFLIPFKLMNKHILKNGSNIVAEWNSLSKNLIQGIKHIFFLKAHNLINSELLRGQQSVQNYKNSFLKYYKLAAIKQSVPLIIGITCISFLTLISINHIGTSPAKLLAFIYIFIRLSQSVSQGSSIYSNFQHQKHGIDTLINWNNEITSLFSNQLEIENGKKNKIEKISKIQIENLSFSYSSNQPVLSQLNINATIGEIIVIKGPSGAGKSTLLSLILGINKPTTGKILINDLPIESIENLNLSYVGPEPYIVPGTVRENLFYGLSNIQISDDQIWNALELLDIKKTIANLPNQLDEKLQEQTQLSTGQLQRLSLCRALLRKPSMLILDEATANLDKDTETNIVKNIISQMKESIVLTVTHKPTFDQFGTQIILIGESKPS